MQQADAVQPWDDGPGLLDAVRAAWLSVLLLSVAGAIAGYGWASQQTPLYRAQARLLLSEPQDGLSSVVRSASDSGRYIRNQAEFMRSADLLLEAGDIAGIDWPIETLRRRIDIVAESDVDLVTVSAVAEDAATAAALANAVGQAYDGAVSAEVQAAAEETLAELRASQAELEATLNQAQALLDENPDDLVALAERDASAEQLAVVVARARQLSVDAALFGGPIEHLEEAVPPQAPYTPRPLRTAAAGGLFGFALSAAWAWWRGLGASAAQTRERVESLLGAPLLGEIPDVPSLGDSRTNLPAATDRESVAAEAYHFLVAALTPVLRDWDAHTVLVTSPQPGDGKTLTCANLAIAASSDRRTVLLVDADARAQGLRRLAAPALSESAQPSSDASKSQLLTWTPAPGVQIPLTVFGERRAEPAAFFRSPPFAKVMQRMRASADLVLVDSPPLLAVADPSEIAEHVDAVLLVITPDTTIEALHEVRRRLTTIRAPLVGIVLNRADAFLSPYAYGYGDRLDAEPADTAAPGYAAGNGHPSRVERLKG